MSVAAVRTPADYEQTLERYGYERAEEARAVRVGLKEVSEQAAIVERYRDLFTREQLEALQEAEASAEGDDRERLYRLRLTCESGLVDTEVAHREDELENRILASRVSFRGEELPLRAAQARLAVLADYRARDELGDRQADVSAALNPDRLELLRAREELEAELSGEPGPVRRNERQKGISLRDVERAVVDVRDASTEAWTALRARWFDRLLGD